MCLAFQDVHKSEYYIKYQFEEPYYFKYDTKLLSSRAESKKEYIYFP